MVVDIYFYVINNKFKFKVTRLPNRGTTLPLYLNLLLHTSIQIRLRNGRKLGSYLNKPHGYSKGYYAVARHMFAKLLGKPK